jgi:hypothetical protein
MRLRNLMSDDERTLWLRMIAFLLEMASLSAAALMQ